MHCLSGEVIFDGLDRDSGLTTADQHQHVKGKLLWVGEGRDPLCISGGKYFKEVVSADEIDSVRGRKMFFSRWFVC